MWNKKNQKTKISEQTKPNKNQHVDRENRAVVTRGDGVNGKINKGGQLHGDRWKQNL